MIMFLRLLLLRLGLLLLLCLPIRLRLLRPSEGWLELARAGWN